MPSVATVLTRLNLIVPFLIKALLSLVFLERSMVNESGWSEVKVLPLERLIAVRAPVPSPLILKLE